MRLKKNMRPSLPSSLFASFRVLVVVFWAIGIVSASAQEYSSVRVAPSAQRRGALSSTLPARPEARRGKVEAVVPVIHRISGWKLLTILERNNLQAPVKSASEFVHTNIVAGYMFDDGRYIVVRLPQAEVEAVASNMPFASGAGESEPITFIKSDEAELPAIFIGLDAATGLSLLEAPEVKRGEKVKLLSPTSLVSQPKPFLTSSSLTSLSVNTRVRLLAPVATRKESRSTELMLHLRISETEMQLNAVRPRSDDGAPVRIVAHGERLPPALVGAVAVDGAGALVGIVERVTSEEARIIPNSEVEIAVRRVLARRSSVPQPWLGAQGQDLAGVGMNTLLESGWREAEAQRLLSGLQGVVLTTVPPYTPASFADLRPGDVVTRIGERPVRGVKDFSELLEAAGGGAKVQFTVARSESKAQQVVVHLSESFDPIRETTRALRLARLAGVGDSIANLLLPLGLEIVTAPAKLRARLGAEEGLLVVSLRTGGIAAASGLREGDIIERANGRLLTEADANAILAAAKRAEVSFDVVRAGQRINITLQYPRPLNR